MSRFFSAGLAKLHGLSILDALDEPALFGAAIRDHASWEPWRAFLAAMFGLPLLYPHEKELFRVCTGRAEPPNAPVRNVWLICGRRAGKSFCMALVAAYLAVFRNWTPKLSPGERAVVLLVAADREQAKILHRYIAGILSVPLLRSLLDNVSADSIELKGRVVIEVVTRSYRAVRGRSVCAALLDELAFWRDETSSNPDSDVVNAIRPAMATFGSDAVLIGASSPYAKRGVLWEAFAKWHGRESLDNLVWQAATRVMNPSVTQEFIDAEFERDPISAAAEYDAQFRTDIAAYVNFEVIQACTPPGLYELLPEASNSCFGFTDPSGGSADSMTLAIAHLDSEGVAILDCIREVRPPFSPESAVEEFCKTLAAYRVTTVCGDRYAGEWPREQFSKRGVTYEPAAKPKSGLYRELLPLLNSRKAQLLDDKRLLAQLHSLERRTARGGRDSIDHGPGGHDDIANAVAGALVLVSGATDWSSLWDKFEEVLGGNPKPPAVGEDEKAALEYWRDHQKTVRC